jgi:hypothetical protein
MPESETSEAWMAITLVTLSSKILGMTKIPAAMLTNAQVSGFFQRGFGGAWGDGWGGDAGFSAVVRR